MASIKAPKILYFLNGSVPTPADRQTAAKMIGAQVMFRNAQRVAAEHSPEAADGVAGAIPLAYSKFPTYDQAMTTHKAAVDEETAKFGAAQQSLAGQTTQPPVQTNVQPGAPQQTPVLAPPAGAGTNAAVTPVQPVTTVPAGAPQFPGTSTLPTGAATATQQPAQAPGSQPWTPQTPTV